MADTANRGRVLWMLASSRPDLIEVDLKRPGRVDVKVPLLPTSTQAESAALVGALAKRYGLALDRRATRDADAAHADAAHAGRRRSARRQSVSPLAHRERRRGRRARSVPRSATRIPCLPTCSNSRCASRSARRPTSRSCRPRSTSTLRSRAPDMSAKRSYLAAAFNARPFGMPVPPNWFGVAAFALLGAFVNPGAVADRRSGSKACTCGRSRAIRAFARPSTPSRARRTGIRATRS